MNTSYNYADFIGVSLNDNDDLESCVDSKSSQQGKSVQLSETTTQLQNEFKQDKTVE